MTTIVAWAEDAKTFGELAAKGQALGGTVQQFDASGLPDQDSATIALGLADAAKKAGATLVLVAASKKGKDVGPRVAAHLDWPFASECQAISGGGNGWTVERMVLSGNSKATYTTGPNAVCTIMPKTFEGAGQAAGKVAGSAPASKVKVVAKQEASHSDFDLSSAAVVVGVGRGFKQQADIKLASDAAAPSRRT
jgi:electron transfer flavoprotein alpha subunit